ncbi:MAG: hypothetical protein ACI36V_04190, partial [Coriobacteriales bacterium]
TEITEQGVKAVQTDREGNQTAIDIPAKTVAITMGFKRNDSLYESVKGLCDEVYIIGDADDAQRIADATKAGYRVACEI